MISLLIPTMNRPDFLIRLLHYYRDVGFTGYICIGDSSDATHIEPTKRAVEALQSKLNIIYREYPGVNDSKCFQLLVELASTPYVVYVADDDFLVPAALEQCALFLDIHPDYGAAHGVGVGLGLKSSGAYGQVAWASNYLQPVVEIDGGSERLLTYLHNIYAVTIFSLHRVAVWREMYKNVSLLADKRFTELLPCCLSVIMGKVKELDCFYLVRQSHDQRYTLPGMSDWIAGPNWLPSYQVFRGCLATEIVHQDGIGMEKAQAIVDRAFQSYLTNSLGKQIDEPAGKPAPGQHALSVLLEVVGLLPGARRVWRALNSGRKRESLLATLLSPSSPYYADFMPVYRSVTEVSADSHIEKT